MIEFGIGKEAPVRLNPRPLDGEAVGVEAQAREQRDVLFVAVIAVAGVTRALDVDRRPDVLAEPEVGVGVVAFDLMACRCYAPSEVLWKRSSLWRRVAKALALPSIDATTAAPATLVRNSRRLLVMIFPLNPINPSLNFYEAYRLITVGRSRISLAIDGRD